ncbi:MAG: antibiotic biosynthesis monooxygenase [Candidatus Acidiferrales bacterium]
MVQFVWEFMAREDKVKEFERYYSATGPWAVLFSGNPGYHGTVLLRDAESARRYLTIDRWESVELQQAMRARCATQWEELDRTCEGFTELERRIGVFEEP